MNHTAETGRCYHRLAKADKRSVKDLLFYGIRDSNWVHRRRIDHRRIFAPTSTDLENEVGRGCLAGDVADVYDGCAAVVGLRAPRAVLADRCDERGDLFTDRRHSRVKTQVQDLEHRFMRALSLFVGPGVCADSFEFPLSQT